MRRDGHGGRNSAGAIQSATAGPASAVIFETAPIESSPQQNQAISAPKTDGADDKAQIEYSPGETT